MPRALDDNMIFRNMSVESSKRPSKYSRPRKDDAAASFFAVRLPLRLQSPRLRNSLRPIFKMSVPPATRNDVFSPVPSAGEVNHAQSCMHLCCTEASTTAAHLFVLPTRQRSTARHLPVVQQDGAQLEELASTRRHSLSAMNAWLPGPTALSTR